ncbi:hypothetical protein Tco_1143632 [Tanacetum coccineum]
MKEDKTIENMAMKCKELLEEKPVFHVLENYTYYRKMADEFPWIRKDWRRKRKLKKKRYRGKCLCHALQTLQGFGTRKACPSNDKLLMADNTIARAYRKVRNVRLQISFQAYLCDFLVLHIPVDLEIPLQVRRPFLRTCGEIIDNGKGIMTIDDGVVNHVYHVKKRSKVIVEEDPENDEDWLDVFEVGRAENGISKLMANFTHFFNMKMK